MQKNNPIQKNSPVKISPKGSLGLLAIGDLGLRAWRKVRNNALKEKGE